MDDYPYRAEYAKTNRSKCRKCKENIAQGILRIAAMVQSYHHDGKDAQWFHSRCFFEKHRPKSIEEIDHFEQIRYEDQESIRKKIEAVSGIILPETSKKSKGKKRGAAEISTNNLALKDFGIEYSKSSRAECVGCNSKIMKEDIRIKKVLYDTEIGMKFGGQPKWHHLDCFVAVRHDYGFYVGGEMLEGFSGLSAEDKKIVKQKLQAIKIDENMAKKLKAEPKDETDSVAEQNLEETIKKQSKIMFKIRDKIQAICSKADLQNILFANKSCIVEGVDNLLDRCADFLSFGAIAKCQKCLKGDMMFAKHGYKCNGMVDEWTECGNFVEKPLRMKCKIPSSMTKGEVDEFFSKYKSKIEDRALRPALVDVSKKLNKSGEAREPKVSRKREPLYNMHVVIIGETKKSRDELKQNIEKMGGKLVTKLQEHIAVVISNPEEIEKMNSRMSLVRDLDIQVVPETFLDAIASDSPSETMEKIKSMSLSKWGSEPLSRIPQEEQNQHRESIYEKRGESAKISVKLKNGTAIDPESGLEDVAHVFKDKGVLYTTVMAKTDIEKNKNSFYKLQVLEADTGKNYWVFRGWGRIGTIIGNTKVENFHSAEAAVEEFERLFEEKTGNAFVGHSGVKYKKHKDKFAVVDVDYDEDDKMKKIHEKSSISSKLNSKVQELIKTLFDVDTMKQTMLEFELDLDKMPLGRLSSNQLKQAYQVLKDISEKIESGGSSNEFVGLSNKFFTLIPHNFGMKKLPVIDTLEEVTHKREILDNLIEVEIAYSFLKQDEDNDDLNPLDAHYNQLKTEIKPLSHSSEEFMLIKKYVANTHAATHKEYKLEVVDVFTVERQGEKRRFKPFKKLHNRQLLWHGSRTTNYVGILSHGLKIAPPEAPVTGYMFGKGIYFADMVSKSANYCFTSKQHNVGFMMLSEVALGDMHEMTKAQSSISKPPNGKHSVKGLGKTFPNAAESVKLNDVDVPLGNSVTDAKMKSDLLYNEYIVYDVCQVNIKYLLKMKFNYHKK